MGCSRPLIFSFSSHKEEKEKLPPQKKGGAREVRIPSLRPATSTFPPFDEVAGHNLTGSRDSLVAAAPPGRSEQNRLSPQRPSFSMARVRGFSFL